MKSLTQINPRSAILTMLFVMMMLSLTCSLSIRAGHADTPIAESADQIQPLEAGDRAPSFAVRSLSGETVVFNPEALERPVILITFRGGWCPYCNTHLSELRHVLPEISAMDIDVMFLSGDRPELLFDSLEPETQQDIGGLGYELYSDADVNAAIALGIAFRASDRTINRRHEKGQDIEGSSMLQHGVLPVPAVFAIDTGGQIVYSFVEPDYKIRLEAADLLDVAKSLASE